MKKYNKSEIMKNAWTIVKKFGKKISEALKMAWNLAKAIVEMKENDYEPDGTVTYNFWFGYGKSRAYIKRDWVSKYQNGRGWFVNLETGFFGR